MPGIFISYRRSDAPDAVGRIYDRLVSEFGKSQVFKDVDSIPLGQDFRGHLNEIVGDCTAVLAIIGPRWTDIRSESGQKRLDDPDDFVRIELEAALVRKVPVVPVLVGHTAMPSVGQLPASLTSLAYRQAIEVRPDPDFHNDASRLVMALQLILHPDTPPEKLFAGQTRRSANPWLVGLAAVASLAAIALAMPALKSIRATAPPETRVDIVTPATADPLSFALSPDGRQIAFVADGVGGSQLWLRSLGSTAAQPLPGTMGGGAPFWSPDGKSIGFFVPGELKRLDLLGGQPRTICAAGPFGEGSWGTGGIILFSAGPIGPLMRVAATGGNPAEATRLGGGSTSHRTPVFLPDGRHFVFHDTGSGKVPGVYLGDLEGTPPVLLTPEQSSVEHGSLAYLPEGWLLRERSGVLLAQRLDLQKSALFGEPLAVADDVLSASVAANGLIAYRTSAGGQRRLSWRSRDGELLGQIGEPDPSLIGPRVSPDGRRVAYSKAIQGKEDIWLNDGESASRLTFTGAGNEVPVWSPDGRRIVFASRRAPSARNASLVRVPGTGSLMEKSTSGTAEEAVLRESRSIVFPTSWSADGRFLMVFSFNPKTQGDLLYLSMAPERREHVFLQTNYKDLWGQFSPDGRWVAYQSDESGQNQVHVRAFVAPADRDSNASASGQWQVSSAGGVYPQWSSDGKELFFLNPEGELMAASIRTNGAALAPGRPVKLFRTAVFGGGVDNTQGKQYDVAPDGRFLINETLDTAATPITLILNWNPEAAK